MRTVLQLCQDVMKATGYNPPTAIVSAGSPDSKRLVQLVNEVGLELTSRNKWRRLTFEATVSTSATTTYSLPTDLYEIVNDSMWSRTETEQASGPLNEQEWQMLKGTDAVTELIPEWRLEYTQGTPKLVFLPAPRPSTLSTGLQTGWFTSQPRSPQHCGPQTRKEPYWMNTCSIRS
jgi:hypothetical protein